ncbi:MAG TPA: alpha/beta hydrolase-fold protein, partial [Chthoniobacterales bacterium]|nr:alpha/beta hydrolase-fold protein [Chthoniobacterales bacterium]
GSSLGGLLTAYMGTTHSDAFGKIGVFSPAFWAGPNFRTNILNPSAKLPLTIYMDIGSEEVSGGASSDPYWLDAHGVYNSWLDKGYAVNSELLLYPQCGGMHNEPTWSARLPHFYQFALSLLTEPNPLAFQKFPPKLELFSVDPVNGSAQVRFLAPLGIPFTLRRSTDLQSWPESSPLAPATAIWEDKVINEQFSAPPNQRFWRVTSP